MWWLSVYRINSIKRGFDSKKCFVSEGNFVIGSDDKKSPDENDAKMQRLNVYDFDQYEVTNALYAECVKVGVCDKPSQLRFESKFMYCGDDYYSEYLVVYVTWEKAFTFCGWRGLNLPDEAVWEKAASWDDALHKNISTMG